MARTVYSPQVKKEVHALQSLINSNKGSRWEIVTRLAKLKEGNLYRRFDKEYAASTFQVFIQDNFNFTKYQYEKTLALINKNYTKEDFNLFGIDILHKLETYCGNPELTYKKLKAHVRTFGKSSMTAFKKILDEDSEKLSGKPKVDTESAIFIAILANELKRWVEGDIISGEHAKRIASLYKIEFIVTKKKKPTKRRKKST